MFLLWLRQLPGCGDRTPASVPPPAEGRSSPTNTPVFPPSSFVLLSFVGFYIFFSTGQVLLSALSWCYTCTSMSEGVFLMYPWRKMYSTSTYSSAILFSHQEYLSSMMGSPLNGVSLSKHGLLEADRVASNLHPKINYCNQLQKKLRIFFQ